MQSDRSALPVLLTFLKLPKLLSFHILRLAAWGDRKCHREKERIWYKLQFIQFKVKLSIITITCLIIFHMRIVRMVLTPCWRLIISSCLPSAWPVFASPFWFMLFFLRCFFLSVSGEAEPMSLVEEELDTPSTAESSNKITGTKWYESGTSEDKYCTSSFSHQHFERG